MIKPNTFRVIIKPIKLEGITTTGGIVLPGQQKAGENLLYGRIVDPGDTHFKVNQEVFYSEYSAAAFIDARKVLLGEASVSKSEAMVIVAQDDILAYYDDITAVPEITK